MINRTFDDFTILEMLGAGNMGKVYLGRQNSLGREVAIKVMTKCSGGNEHFERFMREARIAASLHHPNIMAVYAVGSQTNFAYIAMEYIQGTSLDDYIRENEIMPQEEALKIVLQLCEGLNAALKENIVHRDIKPANVILDKHGRAKITDFGLSKRMDGKMDLTRTGMILGSPGYMSPEQAEGKRVDFRSDIYSLGASFYQMLTKRMPFSAETVADMIYKHRFEKIVNPRNYNENLDDGVCFILAKMLRKEPSRRYQSYEEIIGDIELFLSNQNVMSTNRLDAKEIYDNFRIKKRGFTTMFSNQRRSITETRRKKIPPLQYDLSTKRIVVPENKEQEKTNKALSTNINAAPNTHITNTMMIETYATKDQGFLKYLLDQGILSKEQADHAKLLQETLNRKVGQISVELEFLTEEEVEIILTLQKSSGKYFGEIAVKEGLISHDEFKIVLQKQADSYIDMYKVLLYDNVLPKEILDEQHQLFLGKLA